MVKNSLSWNIRACKYLFFNKEFKFLVKNFHTQFLKQSMFEASEALHKVDGIKTTSFHQYSWNSEVETTWIRLIGWPHKTSSKYYVFIVLSSLRVSILPFFLLRIRWIWKYSSLSLYSYVFLRWIRLNTQVDVH